jgi:general secretion pathway protein B
VLGLLAAGLAVWLFIRHDASDPKSALVSATPKVQAVAAEPLPPPLLSPVEPTAASAAPAPAPAAVLASAPVWQPPAKEVPVIAATEPSHKNAATLASASAASAGALKKIPASATPPVDRKTSAKAVATAPQDAVVTLNDLPEAIRREQPKLTIGGAMHSANAANRMLILNGQVFHEGDQVTADLVLEQIKLKSAVLVYKGHRYSINY